MARSRSGGSRLAGLGMIVFLALSVTVALYFADSTPLTALVDALIGL